MFRQSKVQLAEMNEAECKEWPSISHTVGSKPRNRELTSIGLPYQLHPREPGCSDAGALQ